LHAPGTAPEDELADASFFGLPEDDDVPGSVESSLGITFSPFMAVHAAMSPARTIAVATCFKTSPSSIHASP
jgi:hypothetical protein